MDAVAHHVRHHAAIFPLMPHLLPTRSFVSKETTPHRIVYGVISEIPAALPSLTSIWIVIPAEQVFLALRIVLGARARGLAFDPNN